MKKTARNNNELQQSCCFDERHEKENVQCFLDYYTVLPDGMCFPFDKSFYFTGLPRNSNKWLLLQAIK